MVRGSRGLWLNLAQMLPIIFDTGNPDLTAPALPTRGSHGPAESRQGLLDALVRDCKPTLLHRDRDGAQALTRQEAWQATLQSVVCSKLEALLVLSSCIRDIAAWTTRLSGLFWMSRHLEQLKSGACSNI